METELSAGSIALAKCVVCEVLQPVELFNNHHIIPVSKGGTDEEQAGACPGCHQNIHRVAELIVHNKRARAEQIVALVYEGKARERFMHYVAIVVASEYGESDDTEAPLIIKLPVAALQRLKTLAYQRHHPGTQRKIGVTRLGREIILQYLESQGAWPPKEEQPKLASVVPEKFRNLLNPS
jgi:hypothetical protein